MARSPQNQDKPIRKRLVYVTGGKGGPGKSAVAIQLVDYLAEQGRVLLIDTDVGNADAANTYLIGEEPNKTSKQDGVDVVRRRLRSEDSSGQIDPSALMDSVESVVKSDADAIVLDAPAGETQLLAEAGRLITASCRRHGIECIIVMVADAADRTPVNVLNAIWPVIKDADRVIVVRNLRGGNAFAFFDEHEVVKTIRQAQNVSVVDMPMHAMRIREEQRIRRRSWRELATSEDVDVWISVEAERLRGEFFAQYKSLGL